MPRNRPLRGALFCGAIMSADLDLRRKRAAYRASHRGTKEMDLLLGRYAQARLPDMGEMDLATFEGLLGEPDPAVQHWIMDQHAIPDDRYADLIALLKAFHQLPARG